MPPSPRAGEPVDGEAVTAGREGRLGSAEGLCQHRLPPYETRRWAMAERGRFAMKAGVGGCRAAGVRVRLCAGRRLRVIGTLGPCSPGLGDSDTREDLGGTSEMRSCGSPRSLPLPPQPHPQTWRPRPRGRQGAVQVHTEGQSRVLSLRRHVGLLSAGSTGGGRGALAGEVEDDEPAEDEDTCGGEGVAEPG